MRKGKGTSKPGQCNRREFLKGAAVVAGGAMLGSSKLVFAKPKGGLPQPNRSGIDHTSVLRMIEWRWNLRPLTIRDVTAQNLATALDFRNPNTSSPLYAVPPGPFGGPCMLPLTATAPTSGENWDGLRDVAAGYGWAVP